MTKNWKENDRRRRVKRKHLLDLIKDQPCADCRTKFPPSCMDFDHVPSRGPKKFAIASNRQYSIRVLLAEIVKCDVVCANCHRLRTDRRRG